MYRATKDIILPTTITGSLPRPSWYTENLGTRHFLEAMVSRRFREQYEDALTCYPRPGLRLPTRSSPASTSSPTATAASTTTSAARAGPLSAEPHVRLRHRHIRCRRRPGAAASGFRAATSCTTIWNCA